MEEVRAKPLNYNRSIISQWFFRSVAGTRTKPVMKPIAVNGDLESWQLQDRKLKSTFNSNLWIWIPNHTTNVGVNGSWSTRRKKRSQGGGRSPIGRGVSNSNLLPQLQPPKSLRPQIIDCPDQVPLFSLRLQLLLISHYGRRRRKIPAPGPQVLASTGSAPQLGHLTL